MRLTINGEERQLPDSIQTVKDLLAHFRLENKIVVVEVNRDILEKEHHSHTQLSDGDKIEIVHFVGGG